MAFARPSLVELLNRARADITDAMELAITIPRRSVEDMLARALAGLAHGLHGHLAWVAEQILPDRATAPFVLRWGALLGLSLRAPTKAVGVVHFNSPTDLELPLGTLMRSDAGIEYEVVGTFAPGGELSIAVVQAVEPGTAGNLESGELTLVSPVAGISSEGAVQFPGLTGGADQETIEQLRSRVVARLAQGNGCGAPGDYVAWALETPTTRVLRAWEFPERSGAGTVDVFVTVQATGEPDFVNPSTEQLEEIQAYLDSVAPVTVEVTAIAPTQQGVAVTFTSLTPDTEDVREAIEAELRSMFFRDSAPGETILLSHVREAISAAEGEVDFTISAPAGNTVASSTAHLPVLGTITWPT
jgi:uncharacterized phage protein gp47/JayE